MIELKMVVYVAFLIHIYQPPGQVPSVLKRIVSESYNPFFELLQKHDHIKITLNINGILTEQLFDYGEEQVIDKIKELAEKGQIEFTGSAKYHAILPLIPEEERTRQIILNRKTNEEFFGNTYDPKGFFPPEMAVSSDIFSQIKQTGHEWVIMSGIANPEKIFPTQEFYTTKDGLNVVFRDDIISNEVSFDKLDGEKFIDRVQYKDTNNDYYVIIAQDGETYGHHVKHAFEKFLKPFFELVDKTDKVEIATISELIGRFGGGKIVEPIASSWSTSPQDLENNNPFPLWYDPQNKIHYLQHKLMSLVINFVRDAEKLRKTNGETDKYWSIARTLLDMGLHSCQQWWASKRPWYSPNLIINGLDQLRRSAVNAYLVYRYSGAEKSVVEEKEVLLDEVLLTQQEIIHLL